jgi:hypothetical protein
LELWKVRVVIGCLRNQFGRHAHAGLAATAQPQLQHSPHLPSSLVHTGSPIQMLDQHKLRGKSNLRHAGKPMVRIAYHVVIDGST